MVTARLARTLLPLALLIGASACTQPAPPTPTASGSSPQPEPSGATRTARQPSALPPPSASASTQAAPSSLPTAEFARTFHELSESGEYFFSDNTISNETSYLQVAAQLQKVPAGGAYLGVGPEQNFTYIALTRPELAFIVDIRRDNALLHLLYKSIFQQARTRAQFLALLLGRSYDPVGDPGVAGDLASVIRHAQKCRPEEAKFHLLHDALIATIAGWGIALSPQDEQRLATMHQRFFDRQLELRFELHQANGRQYPSLEELLGARDPDGAQLGFLASRDTFETVQRLQRLNRVIPVVGDFAGRQALQGVAAELKRRQLAVSTFYVSNVEQYLFDPPQWAQYVANVEALPARDDAIFIRSYLDQGRHHPQQLAGHRTATVLQPWTRFTTRQHAEGYRSFWQLATDQ